MHEHERLVRAMDDAARTKDYEGMRDCLAPDLKAWSPTYDVDSADAFIEAIRAQNDLPIDISTQLTIDVAGPKVFWESEWTATYPALGKTVSLRALSVGEVENGRLTSIRQYWDNLGVMTELGLIPSQA